MSWWRRRSIRTRVAVAATGAAMASVLVLGTAILTIFLQVASESDPTVDLFPADLTQRIRGSIAPAFTGGAGLGPPDELTIVVTAADDYSDVIASSTADRFDDAALARPEWRRAVAEVRAGRGAVAFTSVQVAELLTVLALLVLILLVVAGVTWWTTSRALRPVGAIRAEVDEISGRRLDRRVPVPPGDDEVARLARTMNTMLDRLQAAAAEQRRFIADASHELRNPVAAIRAAVEVPLAHPGTVDPMAALRDLDAESLRLQHVVTDLLDLARLGEGHVGRRAEVDLDDVVLEEVERVRRRHPGHRVDVRGVGAGRVDGDAVQLGRLVRNLLENAVRYGHGRTAVGLTGAGGTVRLVVDDDGPGIPVEQRERVFEAFVRLDQARDREAGGTGLGLALVRTIATAHGGGVEVADAPGGGARVVVTLPAEAPGGSPDPAGS